MTQKPSVSFDETRTNALKDPDVAALYLEECLADNNIELFTEALKHVAKARLGSIGALSDKTELGRETLYKMLSKKGNPRLDTLTKVLHATGLRLSISTEATA